MVMLPVQIVFYSSLAILSAQYDIIMRKEVHKTLMRKPCIWAAIACMFVGVCFISYSIVFFKAYRQGEIIADKGYGYDAMNKLNKFGFVISGEPWYKLRKCDYLLHTGNYGQAITQLEEAKNVTAEKTIYFSLGSLYNFEKKYNRAEEQYLFLYYALPNLLKPKYLLAKLYYETGQSTKWEKEANEVLNFRPKVPSVETEAMITEIQGLKNNKKILK
jgi:tetratricopeptide (TPR) repeat protein